MTCLCGSLWYDRKRFAQMKVLTTHGKPILIIFISVKLQSASTVNLGA